MEKDEFYFQGKWFKTSDEMFEYAQNWPNECLDQETAERLFKRLSKDCILNLFILGKKMTNKEACEIINELFDKFIQLIRQIKDREGK